MIKLSFNVKPTEKDCVNILKLIHQEKGFICKKCKHTHYYWKSDKSEFECKICKHRKSLKVDTVMHRSKLPISYWVMMLDIILFYRCTIKQLQAFFNRRYQTIYNMHLTISKQLKRSKPIVKEGLVSDSDFPIHIRVNILQSEYQNDDYPIQKFDWELTKLYLKWLSQPLVELD